MTSALHLGSPAGSGPDPDPYATAATGAQRGAPAATVVYDLDARTDLDILGFPGLPERVIPRGRVIR